MQTLGILIDRRFVLALIFLSACSAFARSDDSKLDPRDAEFFEAKVRPLLVKECYGCHSNGAKKIRGGLLLDSKPAWAKGGESGPVIAPGKPDESTLIKAVRYTDEDMKMPPKGKLTPESIAILEDWVKRGAPDPRTEPTTSRKAARVIDIEAGRSWWAFQPLSSPDLPQIKDQSWCHTSIDRFIKAKLEAAGIKPNAPADRRTLIRRTALDVIGLPPTPDEVEAFVDDPDPDSVAFEKVVDRLLASPKHGERWARHWLDLARFGESHGFEHDYDRPSAYHYRDFLIEALNEDMPYDQFVRWQIAGDELAPDDPWALKATGFLGAGVHNTQITANQVEKERYDELDDMANTTGTAFLGLSIGCARCHDHKFDPIPQSDYYRILSTFTTTVRSEIDLVANPKKYEQERTKYEQEHAPYVKALAKYEAGELPGRLAQWERDRVSQPHGGPSWVVLEPTSFASKGGATLKKLDDQSLKAEGKNPDFDTYTITVACDLPEITAVRVEALADDSLAKRGPGRAGNGNFDLTDLKLTIGPRYGIGTTFKAKLINPKATFEQAGLPILAVIDGDPKSGWAVDPKFGVDHAAVFELGSELEPNGGATLTFTLDFQGNTGHNIGRVRVSATSTPRPVGIDGDGVPPNIAKSLSILPAERTKEQTAEILGWYRTIDLGWRTKNQSVEDHAKSAPKSDGVKALICSEGLPPIRLHTQGADFLPKTHFLKRGDPNQKQAEATQGFLQVLMRASDGEKHWLRTPPGGSRTSYRRAGLADWLTDPDQGAGSLLARVAVNRLWQHHLGKGLVATSSDFGAQGEKPSHAELLDWLAGELIRGGWRLKHIHKLILMSNVYQESSRIDPQKQSLDPKNVLEWRRTKMRLEAETIRDAMLSVSGTLDSRMFGPGSLDERQPRRSIYFTVKRSKLVAMMTLFDAPDALTPIAVRSSTTVAPQALLLLNNPIVREWAGGFEKRVCPSPSMSLESVVRSAYLLAVSRGPQPDELTDAITFINNRMNANPPQTRQSALTDFCQVMFGLNEFIHVE